MASLDKFRAVDIRLDKANEYYIETQFAKEGDYNGRDLVVQITNAGEVTSQTGVTLNLGWKHEAVGNKGLDPFEVVDASQGIFKISYPTEMLNAGTVVAVIQVVEDTKITLTRNFKITVEKSPIDESAVVSENSFTVLQDALLTVNQYDNRIANVENTKVDKSTFEQSTNNLTAQLQQKADEGKLEQVKNQVDAFQTEQDLSPNKDLEVVALRTNTVGVDFPTSSRRMENIEKEMLADLDLTHSFSRNKADTSFFSNKDFTSVFSTYQNIFVNDAAFEAGKSYRIKIYFTDGTSVNSGKGTWYFVYTDTFQSTPVDLVTTITKSATLTLSHVRFGFTAGGKTFYAGKTIDYILILESTEIDFSEESFVLNWTSETLQETMLKPDYITTTSNLFDINAVTDGLRIEAFAVTNNPDYFTTDYIPVVNGESVYGVGGAGATVAYAYNSANVKLSGYLTFNLGANEPNLISLPDVAYIRFSLLNTTKGNLLVSKSKIVKKEKFKVIEKNNLEGLNNTSINFWEGKFGDSLGDSLTGQGFFQKYVRQYFNLSAFYNHGVGGSKLSGPSNQYGASMWEDSRINALNEVDFLTVMGGANDGTVTIGALTLENVDTNTFAGALNTIIAKLYYKYQKLATTPLTGVDCSGVVQVTTAKDIKIFLCTPFYMPSETDDYRTKNLANAVREIAKLWGLPVADVAGKSMLNKGVADLYWGTDRTHPLEIAHRDRIAPVMIGEMEKFKPIDFEKCNYV